MEQNGPVEGYALSSLPCTTMSHPPLKTCMFPKLVHELKRTREVLLPVATLVVSAGHTVSAGDGVVGDKKE